MSKKCCNTFDYFNLFLVFECDLKQVHIKKKYIIIILKKSINIEIIKLVLNFIPINISIIIITLVLTKLKNKK